MTAHKRKILLAEFAEVINRNSIENESDTPDFVIAEYLVNCLGAFNVGVKRRKRFWNEESAKIVLHEK